MHLTDTQAAIGFILLAIGGVLIIWYCCTRTLGPKPQPREDLRPALPIEKARPVRKPAAKASTPTQSPVSGMSNRKRDKHGRYAK